MNLCEEKLLKLLEDLNKDLESHGRDINEVSKEMEEEEVGLVYQTTNISKVGIYLVLTLEMPDLASYYFISFESPIICPNLNLGSLSLLYHV